MKLPLKERLFEDVQDIQATVTSRLRAIPQEEVQRSFKSLLDQMNVFFVIMLHGMIFLKSESFTLFTWIQLDALIFISAY